MKVKDLMEKLTQLNPDFDVWIMPQPDVGDSQYAIKSVDNWDNCVAIAFDADDPNPC